MAWTARPTGDMTLSILDENGFKVLGVDMLKMKTMEAGDDGARLARTLNDLKLLAQAADAKNADPLALGDPSGGLSPTPWGIVVQDRRQQIQVRDASGRRIAERTFGKSINPDAFGDLVRRITEAVERINLRRTG